MSEAGRAAVKRAYHERCEDVDGEDTDADGEDDTEPMGPVSPNHRRNARRRQRA